MRHEQVLICVTQLTIMVTQTFQFSGYMPRAQFMGDGVFVI